VRCIEFLHHAKVPVSPYCITDLHRAIRLRKALCYIITSAFHASAAANE
jgi:hypothetical protein